MGLDPLNEGQVDVGVRREGLLSKFTRRHILNVTRLPLYEAVLLRRALLCHV